MVNKSSVRAADIRSAITDFGISQRPVCVHSSLRSFGHVEGGARTIVESFLAESCTLVVPTFSGVAYELWPDPPDVIPRNGVPADLPRRDSTSLGVYSPAGNDVDREMGAIPAAVLATPARVRGNHPHDSFSAVGPLAHELVGAQSPQDVFAPLEALCDTEGFVLLMGVGLDRLTLLHLAEVHAGRKPFIRWAKDADGSVMRVVSVGGCSDGFPRLGRALASIISEARVGNSRWLVLPASATVELAADLIRANPEITHCDNPACDRCSDAVLGGPLVDGI